MLLHEMYDCETLCQLKTYACSVCGRYQHRAEAGDTRAQKQLMALLRLKHDLNEELHRRCGACC